jgi:hypothetical protein
MPETDLPHPRRANVKQLANRIKGTGDNPSVRFCFLLGAGASINPASPSPAR